MKIFNTSKIQLIYVFLAVCIFFNMSSYADTVPMAPSNVEVTIKNQAFLQVTWNDNSSNETRFKVEYEVDGCGVFVPFGHDDTPPNEVGPDVTQFSSLDPFAACASYVVRVSALNAAGRSAYAYSQPITIPRINSPSGYELTGMAITNSVAFMTLDTEVGQDVFVELYRDGQLINTYENYCIQEDKRLYIYDDGLTPGKGYYYFVKIKHTYSTNPVISWNPSCYIEMPSCNLAPSAFGGYPSDDLAITLSWIENSVSEQGIKIERLDELTNQWICVGTKAPVAGCGNLMHYKDSGLPAEGKLFKYRAASMEPSGEILYSKEINITSAPIKPSMFKAEQIGDKYVFLTWQDNSQIEDGFIISRYCYATNESVIIGRAQANTRSFVDSYNLKPHTEYMYSIYATYNNVYVPPVTITVRTELSPAHGLRAEYEPANGNIYLYWQFDDQECETIEIDRRLSPTSPGGSIIRIPYRRNGDYIDNRYYLNPNTFYYYRIRCIATDKMSAWADFPPCVTTAPPAVLYPPSHLTGSVESDSKIKLTWQPPSCVRTGFEISRYDENTSRFIVVSTVGAQTYEFTDTGLVDGYSYRYKVSSVFNQALSASNPEVYVYLPSSLNPPTVHTAQGISPSEIKFTWDDNSPSETGFEITCSDSYDGTYQYLATVGANETVFIDSGLPEGTERHYKVEAVRSWDGHRSGSNWTYGVTLLHSPSNFTVNTSSSEIGRLVFNWQDNSNAETEYVIAYEKLDTGEKNAFSAGGMNSTSCVTIFALGEYRFSIHAYKGVGTSHSTYSTSSNNVSYVNMPKITSISAQALTYNKVKLSFEYNCLRVSDVFFEASTDNVNFVQVDHALGSNICNFKTHTLNAVPETLYYYRIRFLSDGYMSGYSQVVSVRTPSISQSPPDGLYDLKIRRSLPGELSISWYDNSSNEDGFKIEQLVSGDTWTLVGTVLPNTEALTLSGLTPGVKYSYRVCAYNQNGISGYLQGWGYPSQMDLSGTPQNVTATVSNGNVLLKWDDVCSQEKEFIIETSLDGVNFKYYYFAPQNSTSANVYAPAGITSYFRVSASNDYNSTPFSQAVSVLVPLRAPHKITAEALSETSVLVTWADHGDNHSDGYIIKRKKILIPGISDTGYITVGTMGRDGRQFIDTGCEKSSQYVYQIQAYSVLSTSEGSIEKSVNTPPNLTSTPQPVTGLTGSVLSESVIRLQWLDNSSNATGYAIMRIEGARNVVVGYTPANVTTYDDKGLPQGYYYYKVMPFNYLGWGTSGYVTVSNYFGAPHQPTNSKAVTASDSSVYLSWADNSMVEEGYKIYRKTGETGSFENVLTSPADSYSCTDTGLQSDTTYYYHICAYKTGSPDSPFDVTVSAKTKKSIPLKPENIKAKAASKSAINLSWTDRSNNEEGFKIERREALQGEFAQIASTGTGCTAYSDTGLKKNTYYIYRIRAYNCDNDSEYSYEVGAVTLDDPPESPENLSLSVISSSRINLTWTDKSSNESGFRIFRRMESGGYLELTTVNLNATSFNDSGLTQNTVYYYKVCAYNSGGKSGDSNEASITTFKTAPVSPSNLKLSIINAAQIKISWTDCSNNEEGFRIERKEGNGEFGEIFVTDSNIIEYTDTDVIQGAVYKYRLRAFNNGGVSAYTNEISNALPNAPSNLLQTNVTSGSVSLSWKDCGSGEDGYAIERHKDGDEYAEIIRTGAGVSTITYTDNYEVIPATKYYYRVRAFNAFGYSAYSNEIYATTKDIVPSAPSGLTGQAQTASHVKIQWVDNSNNEKEFIVQRKTVSVSSWTRIARIGANSVTYDDWSVSPDTEYLYRVFASNDIGSSTSSNESEIKTPNCIPFAPVIVSAQLLSSRQAKVTWQDVSNETGFELERALHMGSVYVKIADVGKNICEYTDAGLMYNIKYYYRVRACNALGNSSYSDVKSVVTPVDPYSASMSLNNNERATRNKKIKVCVTSSGTEGDWEVRYSNDAVNWSDWEPHVSGKERIWSVVAGKGMKTVYAQLRSCPGEERQPLAREIELLPVYPAVALDINNDMNDEIVGTFDQKGIKIYMPHDGQWATILDTPATHIKKGNCNGIDQTELVLGFDNEINAGNQTISGLYIYDIANHQTTQLHSLCPENYVCADITGDGIDEIIADYGVQYGIWVYDPIAEAGHNWSLLHSLSSKSMTVGNFNNDGERYIVIDFGSPYGIWCLTKYTAVDLSEKWTQMHHLSAEHVLCADITGDGVDEAIIDFGYPYGIWICDTTEPGVSGMSAWFNWRTSMLHSISSEGMATGNFDGDGAGKKDIAVDFGEQYGIWAYVNDVYWVKASSFSGLNMISGNLDNSSVDELIAYNGTYDDGAYTIKVMYNGEMDVWK